MDSSDILQVSKDDIEDLLESSSIDIGEVIENGENEDKDTRIWHDTNGMVVSDEKFLYIFSRNENAIYSISVKLLEENLKNFQAHHQSIRNFETSLNLWKNLFKKSFTVNLLEGDRYDKILYVVDSNHLNGSSICVYGKKIVNVFNLNHESTTGQIRNGETILQLDLTDTSLNINDIKSFQSQLINYPTLYLIIRINCNQLHIYGKNVDDHLFRCFHYINLSQLINSNVQPVSFSRSTTPDNDMELIKYTTSGVVIDISTKKESLQNKEQDLFGESIYRQNSQETTTSCLSQLSDGFLTCDDGTCVEQNSLISTNFSCCDEVTECNCLKTKTNDIEHSFSAVDSSCISFDVGCGRMVVENSIEKIRHPLYILTSSCDVYILQLLAKEDEYIQSDVDVGDLPTSMSNGVIVEDDRNRFCPRKKIFGPLLWKPENNDNNYGDEEAIGIIALGNPNDNLAIAIVTPHIDPSKITSSMIFHSFVIIEKTFNSYLAVIESKEIVGHVSNNRVILMRNLSNLNSYYAFLNGNLIAINVNYFSQLGKVREKLSQQISYENNQNFDIKLNHVDYYPKFMPSTINSLMQISLNHQNTLIGLTIFPNQYSSTILLITKDLKLFLRRHCNSDSKLFPLSYFGRGSEEQQQQLFSSFVQFHRKTAIPRLLGQMQELKFKLKRLEQQASQFRAKYQDIGSKYENLRKMKLVNEKRLLICFSKNIRLSYRNDMKSSSLLEKLEMSTTMNELEKRFRFLSVNMIENYALNLRIVSEKKRIKEENMKNNHHNNKNDIHHRSSSDSNDKFADS
ncbi:hypothetical protein SNEBB_009274 [Seison nebaliae]|nr:hypothetical protein SNEBB_009274 [Seison nebaliae]